MRSIWRKPGCWVVIVFTLFVCYMLIGFSINFPPKSPLQRLEEARALWEAKGSDNYRMEVGFGSFSFIGTYELIVEQNKVISVQQVSTSGDSSTQIDLSSEPGFFSDPLPSKLSGYTIDNIFSILAPMLQSATTAPPIIEWCNINPISPGVSRIIFDEELGYIRSWQLSSCPNPEFGGGMLCPAIGDCYAGVSISSLELLSPG